MAEQIRRITTNVQGKGTGRVKHYIGFPESLGMGEQKPLPDAVALLIMEEAPGSVFLYRLNAVGEDAGDTWHPTLVEAREQAEFEYGDALGEWVDIPPEIDDPREYSLRRAAGG